MFVSIERAFTSTHIVLIFFSQCALKNHLNDVFMFHAPLVGLC